MWETADILRVILLAVLFGMLMIAILYLRQRKLSTLAYVLWGIFALLLPVVGPYLAIASQPGKPGSRDRHGQ
jgi:predicted membrane channel-forming protein YqfA (hemolysin III family)